MRVYSVLLYNIDATSPTMNIEAIGVGGEKVEIKNIPVPDDLLTTFTRIFHERLAAL